MVSIRNCRSVENDSAVQVEPKIECEGDCRIEAVWQMVFPHGGMLLGHNHDQAQAQVSIAKAKQAAGLQSFDRPSFFIA